VLSQRGRSEPNHVCDVSYNDQTMIAQALADPLRDTLVLNLFSELFTGPI